MIPDKLLINLKIISKIQKNGRITRSYDGIISLENEIFYQSIKRFFSNDSRRQATFEINSVINEAVDMLRHILNSKYMNKNFCQTDEYIKNCENISLILAELESAKAGIENLKFTYQNDQNTSSQIDIIILKINTSIRDFSQKLHYFQSFLHNIQYQNMNYTFTDDVNRRQGPNTIVPQNYELNSVKIDSGEQNEYNDQNEYEEQDDTNDSI
jgi:phosphoglycerate-specific signal transduction histidine kinase